MITFISDKKGEYYPLILESLRAEGLIEDELPLDMEERLFWVMLRGKEFIGFAGIYDHDFFLCVEYFWIKPDERSTKDKMYKKLLLFLQKKLRPYKGKIVVDVKRDGSFKYLFNFVKKTLGVDSYGKEGNSSFFLVDSDKNYENL